MARRHAIVFGLCVFLLCQVFRGEVYSQITFSDGSIQKQIIFVQPGQKTLNLSLPEGLSFTHVGLQISGEDAHVLKWFYGFQDFPFLPGGVRGTDTAFDRPRKFQAQSFISPFSGHIEAIRICLALGPCGGLSISLRSDAGGLPGAILVEDKSYRHAIMPEAIPFQVSLAYSLQAGQEYWLVAEMTEDGGLAATHRGGDDHYSDGVFIWGDGQSYRAEASQENQEVLTASYEAPFQTVPDMDLYFELQFSQGFFVRDPSLDVGGDGDIEWAFEGDFNCTVYTTDISEEISEHYDPDAAGNMIPIVLSSASPGVLTLSTLVPLDTDGDGLPDGVEDANGNGEVDSGETDPCNPDTDSDGLSDFSELEIHNTDPTLSDTDGDGLGDGSEIDLYGADPNNVDTDGDTLDDFTEVSIMGTDPTNPDTDGDGLRDDQEDKNGDGQVDSGETDPLKLDTDGDGLDDQEELTQGQDGAITDPLDPDTDNDNLSDGQELILGTDPTNDDTDGDGLDDQEESILGADGYLTDPLQEDSDSDGLTDKEEFEANTSPVNADTDGDGLSDYHEIAEYYSSPTQVDTDEDSLDDFAETQTFGTDPNQSDTDGDGLPDPYEVNHQLDPLQDDSGSDPDEDGLTNDREREEGTQPREDDTDGDGLMDGDEVDIYNTDPLDSDSDGDGISDGRETEAGSSPLDPDSDDDGIPDGIEPFWEKDLDGDGLINAMDTDSDGDGLLDYEEDANQNGSWDEGETSAIEPDSDGDQMADPWEITWGFDPKDPNDGGWDRDGDGLINMREFLWRSDPNASDSDGDGIPDKKEVDEGLNPIDPNDISSDLDNDGLSNLTEYMAGMKIGDADSDGDGLIDGQEPGWDQDTDGDDDINALDTDSDGDGLSDGEEVFVFSTNPLLIDSDSDGLSDGDEVKIHNTSPLSLDSDGDGIEDGEETSMGIDGFITDPMSKDTDGDGLTDYEEIAVRHTNPNNQDTDGDGAPDGDEILLGLNPLIMDTDEDLLMDGQELALGTDPGSKDSDLDEVWDGYDPDPLDPDTDNDGIEDGQEIVHGFSGFICEMESLGDVVQDPDFSQTGIRITQGSPLVFELDLEQVAPTQSSTYRLYFQARSLVDPNGFGGKDEIKVSVMVDGQPILDQGYPLLSRIYRWYATGDIMPGAEISRLTIEISYDPLISIDPQGAILAGCVCVPEHDAPIFLRTMAKEPDTDGDGLIDGQESFFKTYWFEAELYALDPNLTVKDDQASNSLALVNRHFPQEDLSAIPPGYKYPAGHYTIFIRAKKDAGKDINARASLDVHVFGQTPFTYLVSLTDRFEWQLGPSLFLPNPSQIEMMVKTDSTVQETVWVDKICLLPLVFDGRYVQGNYGYGDDDIRCGIGPAARRKALGGERIRFKDCQPGQINLLIKRPRNVTDPMDQDTDGDGYRAQEKALVGSVGYLTDKFEMDIRTNPFDIDTDADADLFPADSILEDDDGDGKPDYTDDTDFNPLSNDSDDDGLLDRMDPEPLDDDMDEDGILDGNEDRNMNQSHDQDYETDPNNPDTDGDGIQDGTEIGLTQPQGGYGVTQGIYHTDPNIFIPDLHPASITDPLNVDSDRDGLEDGKEDPNFNGMKDANETSASEYDTDHDGLSDKEEDPNGPYGTDANNPDTDGDSLPDGAEVKSYHTDPNNVDTDGDDRNDNEEIFGHSGYFTDPNRWDSDSDGINDGEEVVSGLDGYITNPLDPDTDGDKLIDSNETDLYASNPMEPDTDGDGLTDGDEAYDDGTHGDTDGYKTDPNDADSDNDGFIDGLEAVYLKSPIDLNNYPDFFDLDGVRVRADQWSYNDANHTLIGTGNIKIGPSDFSLSFLNGYPIQIVSCDQGVPYISMNLQDKTVTGYGGVHVRLDPLSISLDPNNLIKILCGGFHIDTSACLLYGDEGSIDPNTPIPIGNFGAFLSTQPFVSLSELDLESVNITNGLIRGTGRVSIAGLFSNPSITSNPIYRMWHQDEDLISIQDPNNAEPPFTIAMKGGFEINRSGWMRMGYDPNNRVVTLLNPYSDQGDVTVLIEDDYEVEDAIQSMIRDVFPSQSGNYGEILGMTFESGILNLQDANVIADNISNLMEGLDLGIDPNTLLQIKDYANLLISIIDYIQQLRQLSQGSMQQADALMINYRFGCFFGKGRLNIPIEVGDNLSIYYDLPPNPLFIDFWMNPYFTLMQHWASQTKPGDVHFLVDETMSSPFPLLNEHEYFHRLAYIPDKGHFMFQMRWNIEEEAYIDIYGRLDPLSEFSYEPNVTFPEGVLDPNIQSFTGGSFMAGLSTAIPTPIPLVGIPLKGEGVYKYYYDPNYGLQVHYGLNGDTGVGVGFTSLGLDIFLAGGSMTALFEEPGLPEIFTLGTQDEVKVGFTAGFITLQSVDFSDYAQFVCPMRTHLVILDFEENILTLYTMTRYRGFTVLLKNLQLDLDDPQEGIEGCVIVDYSILSNLIDLDDDYIEMCGSIDAQGCFDFERGPMDVSIAGFGLDDALFRLSCDGLEAQGMLQTPIGDISASGLISVETDYSITYELSGTTQMGCLAGFCLADANVSLNNNGLIIEGSLMLPSPVGGSVDLSGQIFGNGSYDLSGSGNLTLAGFSVSNVSATLSNGTFYVEGDLSIPNSSNTVRVEGEIESNGNFSLEGYGTINLFGIGISGDFTLTSAGVEVKNASVSLANKTMANATLKIYTSGKVTGSGAFTWAGHSINGGFSISSSGSASLSGSYAVNGSFGGFSVNGSTSFSLDSSKAVKVSFSGRVEKRFTVSLKKPWGGKITKSKTISKTVGPVNMDSSGRVSVSFPYWCPKLTNWGKTCSKNITLDIM